MAHKLTLTMDAAGAMERVIPSLEWALNSEVLTEEEAADVLLEEILATVKIDG